MSSTPTSQTDLPKSPSTGPDSRYNLCPLPQPKQSEPRSHPAAVPVHFDTDRFFADEPPACPGPALLRGRGGPDDDARTAALEVLADPVRRAMVERLVDRPSSVGRLASGFAISRAAISQHLKILLRAGLVTYLKRGAHNIYSVNPEPLQRLHGYVQELSREARWTASQQGHQARAFEGA